MPFAALILRDRAVLLGCSPRPPRLPLRPPTSRAWSRRRRPRRTPRLQRRGLSAAGFATAFTTASLALNPYAGITTPARTGQHRVNTRSGNSRKSAPPMNHENCSISRHKSINRIRRKTPRQNHNPRVGGSSPSSGTYAADAAGFPGPVRASRIASARRSPSSSRTARSPGSRTSPDPTSTRLLRLHRIALEVVHLVLRASVAGGVVVPGVLVGLRADRADAVGLAGSLLRRGGGLVVVVGEVDRVLDRRTGLGMLEDRAQVDRGAVGELALGARSCQRGSGSGRGPVGRRAARRPRARAASARRRPTTRAPRSAPVRRTGSGSRPPAGR